MTGIDAHHRALQARMGERIERDLAPVPAEAAVRFAIATGDDDPRHRDPAAARALGHADLVVPPLYLGSVREWGAGSTEEELRGDGTSGADVGLIEGARVLGGGQELTFLAEVVVGEPLRMEAELTGVERKDGSAGPLVIASIRRTFHAADGRDLVVCDETRVLR